MTLSLLYSAAADVGRELLHLGAFLLLWAFVCMAATWITGVSLPADDLAWLVVGIGCGWLIRARER